MLFAQAVRLGGALMTLLRPSTHGLELMRLARTASPRPRRSARLDSNQRSPAPEAGGVANSPTGSRKIIRGRAARPPPLERPARSDGGSRIRTCERSPVYALATRCLAARPCLGEAEGEGVEPPRP